MKNKKLTLSIIALIFVVILGAFLAYGYYQKATYSLQRPIVSMEIDGYGTIKMELYPDEAPNTVKNFIKLINEGYYNGLTFYEVEENLIKCGLKAEETVQYSINGEFTENGHNNTLKFERGTLGLEREDYSDNASIDATLIEEGYNSGYAKFFIVAQDEEKRDGYYTAFGKVIEGIEIVDEITKLETTVETNEETGETTETTKPVNPPAIKSISVDTFGVEYGEPETHETFDINEWFMNLYGISY